jgi:hypothetical protein
MIRNPLVLEHKSTPPTGHSKDTLPQEAVKLGAQACDFGQRDGLSTSKRGLASSS